MLHRLPDEKGSRKPRPQEGRETGARSRSGSPELLHDCVRDPREQLSREVREEVALWLAAHPQSFLAQLQPRLEREAIGWSVRHRFDTGGQVTGSGPTIAVAMSRWEANFLGNHDHPAINTRVN